MGLTDQNPLSLFSIYNPSQWLMNAPTRDRRLATT